MKTIDEMGLDIVERLKAKISVLDCTYNNPENIRYLPEKERPFERAIEAMEPGSILVVPDYPAANASPQKFALQFRAPAGTRENTAAEMSAAIMQEAAPSFDAETATLTLDDPVHFHSWPAGHRANTVSSLLPVLPGGRRSYRAADTSIHCIEVWYTTKGTN